MDAPHIYVFANRNIVLSQPGQGILHAGGFRRCIEVEDLALLEHSATIRTSIDGVFLRTRWGEERVAEPVLHLSDRLIQEGITDTWFTAGWSFGNGVTCHRTQARFETKTVEHSSGLTQEEILDRQGYIDLSRLTEWRRVQDRTERWAAYERRWRAGSCPQYSHWVHLTWMVVQHELRGFGYSRILELTEELAEPHNPDSYAVPEEPGKYLSTIRVDNEV